jgi:DNA-binding beta-propeller fold protein YncE
MPAGGGYSGDDTISKINADGTKATLVFAPAGPFGDYDGNILAFSPDGPILFVADRNASRIVCIEPAP